MIPLTELWRLAGWTMLHYLWIGLAIGAVAVIVRIALRRTSPIVRYSAQLVMFAMLAFAPLVIAARLAPTSNNNSREATLRGVPQADVRAQTHPVATPSVADHRSPAIVAQSQPVTPQTALQRWTFETIAHALPWLWLAGAPLTFALLASGVLGVERLKRSAQLLTTGPVREACDRLTLALRVSQRTVVAISDAVAQPVLVGIVRPLILLPAALVAECSPEQLELVLAHELAHVRRRDNLVNLVQRIVESVLFFQPAVWLVSHWLRRDREECCDALVVAATGRPQQYAELLYAVASHQSPWQLGAAMARHPVAVRIRKILNLPEETMLVPRRVLLGFVTGCAALLLAVATYLPRVQAEEVKTVTTESTEKSTEEQKPKFAKEEYRYEGKTFAEWNQAWRTELSPKKRLEAVEALGAFGRVGYEKEAVGALLDVAAEYDWRTIDSSPTGKIQEAIKRELVGEYPRKGLPTEFWLPRLESESKPEKIGLANYCVEAIPSAELKRMAHDNNSPLKGEARWRLLSLEANRCQEQNEAWPSPAALEIMGISANSKPEDWLPIMNSFPPSSGFGGGGGMVGRGTGKQFKVELFPELSDLLLSEDQNVQLAAQNYTRKLEHTAKQELAQQLSTVINERIEKAQLIAAIRTAGGLEIAARGAAAKKLKELQRHADEEIAIAALVAWCKVNDIPMLTNSTREHSLFIEENRWWTEFVEQRFPNALKFDNRLRDIVASRSIVSADKPPRELTEEESEFIDQYLALTQRVLKERDSYPRQR